MKRIFGFPGMEIRMKVKWEEAFHPNTRAGRVYGIALAFDNGWITDCIFTQLRMGEKWMPKAFETALEKQLYINFCIFCVDKFWIVWCVLSFCGWNSGIS